MPLGSGYVPPVVGGSSEQKHKRDAALSCSSFFWTTFLRMIPMVMRQMWS